MQPVSKRDMVAFWWKRVSLWLALAVLVAILGACGQQTGTCPQGFGGTACALCQTDAACAASTGDDGATCSTDLTFAPNSQLKFFACSLPPDGLLGGLLEPGSLLVECSSVAGDSTCNIGFVVASPRVQVQCAASGCTFATGQSSLTCSNTSCSCPGDATCSNSALIATLASSVSGQASLDCNATGACTMKITGRPVSQIDATCQAAECLAASAAAGPASVAVPSPSRSPSPSPPATDVRLSGDGSCPSGWEGNGCSLCQTDYSCMAEGNGGLGNEQAKCSRNLTFAPNSIQKSYSCELKGSGLLNDLLVPGTLLVQCFTGLQAGQQLAAGEGEGSDGGGAPAPAAVANPVAPSAPAPASVPATAAPAPELGGGITVPGAIEDIVNAIGGSAAAPAGGPPGINGGGRRRALLQAAEQPRCEIGFSIRDPSVSVKCLATGCTMGAGSGQVQCTKTACECPGTPDCGSAVIQGLIGSATGEAKLDCDSVGNCAIILQGLPISQLDATCEAGECLVATDSQLNTTEATLTSTKLNTNPIIAAVPLMVLLLVAIATGAYTYSQRQMWGYRISSADVAQLEALAAKPALAAHRVGVLDFENISVSVPLSGKSAAKKSEALRRKAMHRSPSHTGTLSDQQSGALQRLVAAAKTKLHSPVGLGTSGSNGDVERAAAMSGGTIAGKDAKSVEEEAAAAEAADFVVGLHHAPEQPDRWYILRGCSGSLQGGQVVGLLGPSGCGKTTLLGSIAGSPMDLGSRSMLTGTVEVDGVRRRKSHVAYVPQSDVLIPSLTVQECLRYSALLRLPQETSPLDLQVHIERVMDELGLRHIADAQVGGSGGIRGVSGGERRRVTIGMELVTDPSILVLDEPTSGLDSYTADILMQALKNVAAPGRVVLASLHQPSRDVFFSLDQVVLMGHGRMLYMGPPGEAEAWFELRGLPCPPGTAVAEHMLRIASDAAAIRHLLRTLEMEGDSVPGSLPSAGPSQRRVASMPPHDDGPRIQGGSSVSNGSEGAVFSGSKLWGKSPLDASPSTSTYGGDMHLARGAVVAHQDVGMSQASSSSSYDEPGEENDKAMPPVGPPSTHRRKATFGRQLSVMFWRTFVDIVRNPSLLLLHSVVAAAMGVITGLVFYDLDYTNIGVQNRMGSTFFALAFLAFTSLTTVDLLISERQVVTREVRGGYYQPSAYLISKLTLDAMLLRVLPAIWYFFAFYYMAGYQTGAAYAASYCFILITFSCVVGAMSMCITIVSSTAGQASFAMNFTLLFSLVFTGFLVNVYSIPAWIRWIHYLSVFYYAFEAMITGELAGQQFSVLVNGSTIPNVSGETFLETLGFKPGQTTEDIGVLVGIYFLLVLLAQLLFLLRLPRQRSGASRWWSLRSWRHATPSKRAAGSKKELALVASTGKGLHQTAKPKRDM